MSSELNVQDIKTASFDNVTTSEFSKDLVIEKSNVFSATNSDIENVQQDEFIPITEEEKLVLPYKIKSD
ncbi:hypothetical protein FOG48_03837 [Hanseniaspora uvarum]|nr:hypothetical protein FOG48_03837 [Hanseniaspora uvarum]